jgi:hypothetical protein
MPRVGFEPTTPVFEQAKTVIGNWIVTTANFLHGRTALYRTARVFSRDSPWKVAQWTGRPIRES